MAVHKKFNFDDPEDSYWNANGPSTSELFDDAPSSSNAAAARAALEDLFESQIRFGSEDASSTADSEIPLEEAPTITLITPATKPVLNANLESLVGGKAVENKLRKGTSFDENNRRLSEIGRGLSVKSVASVVSEGSGGSFSNEPVSQLDYMRIRSEHRRLQRHLEQVKRDRYKPADPEITVRRLQNGEPVTLDLYRSKKEKLELLDAALDSLDGNAIFAVVLFLKKTLSDSLFREILFKKVVAANHYVAYLKQIDDYQELSTTLFALGRHEEACMVEFSAACRQRLPESKIRDLKRCLVSSFSSLVASNEAKIVNEYIDLLERQIPIEAADENKALTAGNEAFTKFPRKNSLVGQSLYRTLHHCCLYHYDLPMNAFASPLSIREVFQLNDKHFVWIAVSALSRLARWSDVERLLTSKKLLGGNKIVCPFSWQHLFRLITAHESPPKELLCKFLRAVADLDERKRIAEQYHDAADINLECSNAQKDKHGFTSFISKLTPSTPDAYKSPTAINNTAHKWNK